MSQEYSVINREVPSRKVIINNIIVYGIAHGLVDAACAAVIFINVFNKTMEMKYLVPIIVLYNILAFALQAPFGFIADTIRRPIETAVSGCILIVFSLIIYKWTAAAICIAGLGNALFHVGGGIVALNLKPGKASMPGIYVAPGALGLLIGTLVGKSGTFREWPFILLLIAASVIMVLLESPKVDYCTEAKVKCEKFHLILLLILTSIAIRALVGFMLNYPWKSNVYLLFAFTLAVVLGKALGGILADRFGWLVVTVSGLLVAAPLLAFGGSYSYLAILGVFLFNLTMPVTMTVTANMFPGRAGFAFGLTTLALIIGAFPTFTSMNTMFVYDNKWLVLSIILFMAFILYKGLKFYSKKETYISRLESNNTKAFKE